MTTGLYFSTKPGYPMKGDVSFDPATGISKIYDGKEWLILMEYDKEKYQYQRNKQEIIKTLKNRINEQRR